MKRLDKDIYSRNVFNEQISNLMDRYQCSIKVYKDFKVSELGDHFETISWFQDDTPYNLMWELLTCVIGEHPQPDKKYLIEKNDTRVEQFRDFEISIEWGLGVLSVVTEMYNEMISKPSDWPMVIHTRHYPKDGVDRSLIHPGNNRWFVSQFYECSEITCDVINIDYTKKETTNIFDYWQYLEKGIRISEYVGEKFELFAPSRLHSCYVFECLEKVELVISNDCLYYNDIHIMTFNHNDKTVKINKLDKSQILKIIDPSPDYLIREEKIFHHIEDLKNNEFGDMVVHEPVEHSFEN